MNPFSYFHPHYNLDISHIATGNGVYSTLNHLLHVLINPGEVILTSAPYYLGFDAMCTCWRSLLCRRL
jgi:aspartate/methionine/tyrosine aminotransferase